jgi:ppGpp synthetase/RelA/SpoT-type nucleotidyltranferase
MEEQIMIGVTALQDLCTIRIICNYLVEITSERRSSI